MRTEGFRKKVVALALLLGFSGAIHPTFAQRIPTLHATTESGGLQPASLGAEPKNFAVSFDVSRFFAGISEAEPRNFRGKALATGVAGPFDRTARCGSV